MLIPAFIEWTEVAVNSTEHPCNGYRVESLQTFAICQVSHNYQRIKLSE